MKALAALGSTERRAVLIDARRGEIYGAVYGPELQQLDAEIVMPFPAWSSSIQVPTELISQDLKNFRDALPWNVSTIEPYLLAGAVAQIASTAPAQDPAAIDANYVRRSDAELFWKDN
ncbi:MAG: hypothetical protein WKF37_19770 [Bryobacteraceae bacterium]